MFFFLFLFLINCAHVAAAGGGVEIEIRKSKRGIGKFHWSKAQKTKKNENI